MYSREQMSAAADIWADRDHDEANAAAAMIRQLLASEDRLREALRRWQETGCPTCNGDCGSANPPVTSCIMQETREALK